jgi:hypothetical protein
MDDNSTMESSSSLPIIEENEKFLSTIITTSQFNNKVVTSDEEQKNNNNKQEENILPSPDKNSSPLSNHNFDQAQSSDMIISTVIDHLLTEIATNLNIPSNSSEEQNVKKQEKPTDGKQATRTLRSHARGKINSSIISSNFTDHRRVSNRKRIFEKKLPLDINEKPPRKRNISERSNTNETSSNSDEQITENLPEKTPIIDQISTNEDTNIGGGDDDSNSAISTKQTHTHPDIDSLPPNKRRLRERNTGLISSNDTSNTMEENVSVETTRRDIPINGIKQFLEIRQQVI